MKKNLKLMGILMVSVVLIGCGGTNDDIMTADEFKTAMEEKGVTVVDVTESAADDTFLKIYDAVDEEKYSFEYYFMDNSDSADLAYEYVVSNLDSLYASDSTAVIVEDIYESDEDYSVSASDYYCVVIKKENTVLFVTAYPDSTDDTDAIIKELGY